MQINAVSYYQGANAKANKINERNKEILTFLKRNSKKKTDFDITNLLEEKNGD